VDVLPTTDSAMASLVACSAEEGPVVGAVSTHSIDGYFGFVKKILKIFFNRDRRGRKNRWRFFDVLGEVN
jgi:hypothetical protein